MLAEALLRGGNAGFNNWELEKWTPEELRNSENIKEKAIEIFKIGVWIGLTLNWRKLYEKTLFKMSWNSPSFLGLFHLIIKKKTCFEICSTMKWMGFPIGTLNWTWIGLKKIYVRPWIGLKMNGVGNWLGWPSIALEMNVIGLKLNWP